jgi:iron complex outermembrane recepter protein
MSSLQGFCSRVVAAACGVILSATFATGQQLSISGTVRDSTGVVPDATVTLRAGRTTPRTATTDAIGHYAFDGLPAGYYELSFGKTGFDTVTRNLALGPDTEAVDVILTVGAVSTSLTVTDVAGKGTASRLDIPDKDLPVQVSSVPKELLQEQGVNDMATALRNASGVQAQRFYGVYEQYTIRGFNASDVLLVDGMRTEAVLNRFATQLNNVESVEVLKGPSSVLYGGDAVSGVINIIRKKPQGQKAYDLLYKAGRFNSHQIAGGATGPIFGSNSWLYRTDVSQDYTTGWRGAGANRFNASPSLTWLMSERMRVTVHQSFTRDNFKGDGGVALEYTNSPFYDPSRRFSLPSDFALMKDSTTHVLFNAGLSSNWEFRDGFLLRRTSEEYMVTEGIYFDPATNTVPREALYFHHNRRPKVNQAELVGHVNFLKMRHHLLFGYDYRDFYTRTGVTAGDDPDCLCGFYGSLAPISVLNYRETNPPITDFTIVRNIYQANRVNDLFWQDQIDLGSKVKINVGGRFSDFDRGVHRIYTDAPNDIVGIQSRHENAYTYRAGIVYEPMSNHQLYASTSSSFSPVQDVPANGAELKPRYGRAYEVGYRWQGWNGRIQTSLAAYHLEQNNLTFAESLTSVVQAGKETSKGIDLDVNADLSHGARLILNYGYTVPRFVDFIDPDSGDLSGKLPRFTQKQALNMWLHKSWTSGFTAAIGTRYLGPMFTNNTNDIRLGGWTTFTGSVGYRQKSWEWDLNAENLFNRQRYFLGSDYSDQVYPGAPINVFATVRYRFTP